MFEFGSISRTKCSRGWMIDLPMFRVFEVRFFDVRSKTKMHKCSESRQTSTIALAMCDIFFWLICKFFGQNMTFLRFPFFKKCTICYTLYYTSIKMSISFLRRKVLYCPVEFISRLKCLSHCRRLLILLSSSFFPQLIWDS